uniref:ParA family protein n=1 Tax=Mastigocoleus sp. MO_188.B34 TaxID=3036635 RepID=UPI00260FDF36
MSKIIALFNQAGGVGKTTLTMNIGYHLKELNQKVLLLDLDPQASLTVFFGLKPKELSETIHSSIVQETSLPIHNDLHGIDLVPANINLSATEKVLSDAIMKELRLKNLLSSRQNEYDFILIDCPPSLGFLSIISLIAATHVLIPI